MNILGVDPGASGALAVIRDGGMYDVVDMPVGLVTVGKSTRRRIVPELLAQELWELLPLDAAYVEEVASMPRQGVSSVFTFGQAHGLILGALTALRVPVRRVRPVAWQTKVKAKGDPRPRALELYPTLAPQLKRKKDEGRADAALIAHYGYLMEKENGN